MTTSVMEVILVSWEKYKTYAWSSQKWAWRPNTSATVRGDDAQRPLRNLLHLGLEKETSCHDNR